MYYKNLFKWLTKLQYISIEPCYFLYSLAWNTLEFVNTNLYLQKACRENATSEWDHSSACNEEVGTTFVASVNANVHSVKMFTIIVLSIFFTSWSEKAGKKRKIFIIMPMVGQLIEIMLCCLYTLKWTWHPMFAVLSEAGLQVLFGNFLYLEIFAYLYICDVSAEENRTMRMGILSAINVVAKLMGKGVSGFMLQATGFLVSYIVCLVLTVTALIIGYCLVKDRPVPVEKKVSPCDAFGICGVFESLKIVFGKGKGRVKAAITLLLLNQIMLFFIREGEFTVMYLYLRYRFHWDEEMYSLFVAYGCVGICIGTLLSSVLLSKILKIHDGILATFASLWDLGVIVAYIFATVNWQLYLISGLDLFFGVSLTVVYSYLSKFFGDHEQGHLFSVTQMFSLIIPLCHPTYNILFKETLHTYPQSIFIISLVLYIFVVLFNGFISSTFLRILVCCSGTICCTVQMVRESLVCIIYALTKNMDKLGNEKPAKTDNSIYTVKF